MEGETLSVAGHARPPAPPKIKENIRLKGAWLVEYMLPCDGVFTVCFISSFSLSVSLRQLLTLL